MNWYKFLYKFHTWNIFDFLALDLNVTSSSIKISWFSNIYCIHAKRNKDRYERYHQWWIIMFILYYLSYFCLYSVIQRVSYFLFFYVSWRTRLSPIDGWWQWARNLHQRILEIDFFFIVTIHKREIMYEHCISNIIAFK